MKKPILPLRIKEHAMDFGQNYAEFVCGLTDANSKEYVKAFEDGVNEFCSQWLEEQTGRKYASNPSIPPGFSMYLAFADELYDGKNSFLGKRTTSENDRKKFARQMMRAVTSLNSIFTSLEAGLKRYDSVSGTSDFGFGIKTGTPAENLPQVIAKIKNRYRRAFTLSILLGMLKNFYSIDGKRVTEMIDRIFNDVNLTKLQNNKPANVKFGDAIKAGMDKAFSNFDAVSEIEKALKESNFVSTVKK